MDIKGLADSRNEQICVKFAVFLYLSCWETELLLQMLPGFPPSRLRAVRLVRIHPVGESRRERFPSGGAGYGDVR